MSIAGSLDIQRDIDGYVIATLNMLDDDYDLAPNGDGDVYAVDWTYGGLTNPQYVQKRSANPVFTLGHVTDDIFDKDILMEMTGHARTRRPWRFTKFRDFTLKEHFFIPSALIAGIPKPIKPGSAIEHPANWLQPMLHQMMS